MASNSCQGRESDTPRSQKYDKLKLDVLGILNVASKYIDVRELESHYKVLMNSDIPFREVGYDSTTSLIQSFSSNDVNFKYLGGVLHFKAVEKDCVKHVTSLIKRTKSVLPRVVPSKKSPRKLRPSPTVVTPLLPPNMKEKVRNLMMSHTSGIKMSDFNEAWARMFGYYLNFGSINAEDMLKAMPDVVSIERRGKDLVIVKNFSDTPKKLIPGKLSLVHNMAQSCSLNEIKEPPADLHPALMEDIIEVLNRHPEGIFSYVFPKVFEKEIKIPFPKKWRPHGDLVKMMQSLPGVICLKQKCFVWFLHVKHPRHSACLNPKAAEEIYLKLIKDFIYDLLFKNPNGMSKDEIVNKYRNAFKEDLNLSSLNIGGIDTLLSTKMDFLGTEYLGGGKAYFRLRSHFDPVLNCSLDTTFILGDVALSGCIPEEVLELPEIHQIMVSGIEKSGDFYFQLHKNLNKINSLMEDLKCFYGSERSDMYRVPDSYLKRDLVCVVKFKMSWHRCIIEDVFHDEVQVFYVDYGTLQWVHKHNVKLLRKEYATHKMFALKGKLAGVASNGINGMLTQDAFDFFLDYVSEKTLNSLLYTYDSRGTILLDLHHYLSPDSSRTKQLLTFNDVLIMKGFAQRIVEPDMKIKAKRKMRINGSHKEAKKKKASEGIRGHVSSQMITIIPKIITKQIKLTEESSMTLINLNNNAYIASCDFSSFLWEHDVACSVLLDTRGRLKICSDEYPDLFQRLRNEILRLGNDRFERVCLTLFELDFVSEFLESTNCCENLKLAIQNAVDLFNPQDFEWTEDKELEELMDELHSFSRELPDSRKPVEGQKDCSYSKADTVDDKEKGESVSHSMSINMEETEGNIGSVSGSSMTDEDPMLSSYLEQKDDELTEDSFGLSTGETLSELLCTIVPVHKSAKYFPVNVEAQQLTDDTRTTSDEGHRTKLARASPQQVLDVCFKRDSVPGMPAQGNLQMYIPVASVPGTNGVGAENFQTYQALPLYPYIAIPPVPNCGITTSTTTAYKAGPITGYIQNPSSRLPLYKATTGSQLVPVEPTNLLYCYNMTYYYVNLRQSAHSLPFKFLHRSIARPVRMPE